MYMYLYKTKNKYRANFDFWYQYDYMSVDVYTLAVYISYSNIVYLYSLQTLVPLPVKSK